MSINLYVYTDTQTIDVVVSIEDHDEYEVALDKAVQVYGYDDHIDYCARHQIDVTDFNIEEV